MNKKFLFSITVCFLVVLLSVPNNSTFSSTNAEKNVKLEKEWELDLAKEDKDMLKNLQPIKVMKSQDNKELYINCVGNIICIDPGSGKILKKYLPEDDKLIFDFVLDTSFLYLSLAPRDNKPYSNPSIEKIDIEKNEVVWKTDLPFSMWGCYFIVYLSDKTILVIEKYQYCLLDITNGKILESVNYLSHTINFIFDSPTFAIKNRFLYAFVDRWQDIFKIELPNLILSKDKVHIEKELPKDSNSCLVEVINPNCFLITNITTNGSQLYIIDQNGKTIREIKPKDPQIRFPAYQVNNEKNKYVNPAVYEDYVFGFNFDNSSICIANLISGEINQTSLKIGNFVSNNLIPYFYDNKLFLMKNNSYRETEITIYSVPDLASITSITENVYNTNLISIREGSFPVFSEPFLVLEKNEEIKLVAIFRSKICMYKLYSN